VVIGFAFRQSGEHADYADLSLDMSEEGAAVPGEIPPVPPAPMALARGNGDGGGSRVDLHFSREMTNTLHITDIDENTFTTR
jgi:hypothetical protein